MREGQLGSWPFHFYYIDLYDVIYIVYDINSKDVQLNILSLIVVLKLRTMLTVSSICIGLIVLSIFLAIRIIKYKKKERRLRYCGITKKRRKLL